MMKKWYYLVAMAQGSKQLGNENTFLIMRDQGREGIKTEFMGHVQSSSTKNAALTVTE